MESTAITNCECPIAGYCKRHNTIKTNHWHRLCSTHQGYFQKWEAGQGPGQKTDRNIIEARRIRLVAGAEHWLLLHNYPFSIEWNPHAARIRYRKWVDGIPSYGCACKSSWIRLTKKYPPLYKDPYTYFFWTIDRHNDVNYRLSKPIFHYREAVRSYNVPTPIPEIVRNSILALQQDYTRPESYVRSLFELS